MADQSSRDYYMRRKGALDRERQSFISHYKELSQFIKPRRGRFLVTDRNKGDKRYNSIINSRATQAHRVATAGMLAGTMSPTRPWFSLETNDPDLMERFAVKDWLYKVENILRAIFNESNFYGMASNFLGEKLLFGTGAMLHVDDFKDVARYYTQTAGSYMIGANSRLEIDTLVREFEWTVGQIVQEFGLANCSTSVRSQYDRGNYEAWFPVCHFIEPNRETKFDSPFNTNKPFRSIYLEPGSNEKHKYLRVSGFDEFPAYVSRWDVTGEDVYGTDCPAMTALGDIKALQLEERRKSQAIDKMVNPPLHGPPSLRNVPVSQLPGAVNIYDPNGAQVLEAVHEVRISLQDLRLDMDSIERRIDEAFFVDLFMAITQAEGIQPRNQLELIQRNEERLLQLGPVLEHLQSEFLDPLINRTFNQCVRAGILPPTPEELAGRELKVKYISTLAQAQRAVATQTIDRMAAFVGNLAAAGFTDALEKFDATQAVDEYAKAVGGPPSIIVPDEVVAQRRAEREAAQKRMETLEDANMAAQTATSLSAAKTGESNALTELMGTAQ